MKRQFLEREKLRQADFKTNSGYFSPTARGQGEFFGRPRSFCLPQNYSSENLYEGIRADIKQYFAAQQIKWHGGTQPSNHLCDSQICCANFLFPFAAEPIALATLLRPIFPNIKQMLPMDEGQFVAYEWIGLKDYLGEKEGHRNKTRTRGALCTSADTAVIFENLDGTRQIVLIEWKYCEAYSRTSYQIARRSKKDRTTIYNHLYQLDDAPFNKPSVPSLAAFFHEPFYQLFRQQLLASEMEKAHELGAEVVSVLHIAPGHNLDFGRVTSRAFEPLGSNVLAVWKKLARPSTRFLSVQTEALFQAFPIEDFALMKPWWEYLIQRYSWLVEPY